METRDDVEGPLARWRDTLEMIRFRCGTGGRPLPYLALATQLRVHENTIMAWTKSSVPGVEHEARLAELGGLPLRDLERLLDAARLALAQARVENERLRRERLRRLRPQPGTVMPIAAPSRKPRSSRRRRLAAVVFGLLTLGSGPAAAQPHAVDFEGPSLPLIGHGRRRYFREVSPAAA
jgi:hypothetical protein